jgi:hypothetical protein
VAGQDYIVVPTPVQVEVPGKIEVREFFGMAVVTVLNLNRICRLG